MRFKFVSTPLSNDTYSTTTNTVKKTKPYSMQPEELYPEIYYDIYPQIIDAVNKMEAAGQTPTPEMIGSLVDSIIKSSGMWFEDEDDVVYDVSTATFAAQPRFGGNSYLRRNRRHHSRNSLRDIVRILLLREIFGRRGSNFGF